MTDQAKTPVGETSIGYRVAGLMMLLGAALMLLRYAETGGATALLSALFQAAGWFCCVTHANNLAARDAAEVVDTRAPRHVR